MFWIAFVASLGGLLFGFDTAVISGTTHSVQDLYKLSPTALGFFVSSALIGVPREELAAALIFKELGFFEPIPDLKPVATVKRRSCKESQLFMALSPR